MERHDSKIYVTLRRAFVILSIVAVVCTGFMSYHINRNSAIEHAWQDNLRLLDMHRFTISTMEDLAFSLGNQIYADNQIAYLLYGENHSPGDKYRALLQLNNYRYSIPHIESIYIYNSTSNTMTISSRHSGDIDVPVESFGKSFDPLITNILTSMTHRSIPVPIPHLIQYGETYKDDTFCYSFIISGAISDELLRQAVVINFSAGWMQQVMKESDQSETLILDENGTVVFSTRGEHIFRDMKDTDLFARIVEGSDTQRNLICTVDGVRQLATLLPQNTNGWHYVRLTPYQAVMTDANHALRVTILIDAFLVLVYVTISLVITKRVYLPIDSMSQELHAIQDKHHQLEHTDRRKRMLRKLLLDTSSAEKRDALIGEVRRTDKELSEGSNYSVMVTRIDRYDSFCKHYSLQERAERMQKMLQIGIDELTGGFSVRTLELGEGSNMVFVLMHNSPAEVSRDTWISSIASMRHSVADQTGIRFSCAVSTCGHGLDTLSTLYRQACNTLNYRIFSEGQCLLFAQDMLSYMEKNYTYPVEMENRMVSHVMNGEADRAKEVATQILRGVTEYPFVSIHLTLSLLTTALLTVMHKTEIGGFEFPPELRQTLYAAPFLDGIDSYETTIDSFCSAIDQLCDSLHSKHDFRHEELVERINRMIDQNYGDPDCSLSTIADSIKMSTAYLARIYKSHTLKSIPEQITSVRMDEARRLLREESGMTIAEISQRVGYSSNSYFSKAFRKEHGMSPNEYRNYIEHEEQ